MRNKTGAICFIAFIALLFAACSSSVSYADRVNTEKKRIKNFLREHDIEVLTEYPSNGVFKSNQYYLDPSGVYINVVDSGNGRRAKVGSEVLFRFKDAMQLPTSESDTISLVDYGTAVQPLQFYYGESSTYLDYGTGPAYVYLSPGVTTPLQYVGEKAIVRLLVPFRNSAGSSYQIAYYATIYYTELEYTAIY